MAADDALQRLHTIAVEALNVWRLSDCDAKQGSLSERELRPIADALSAALASRLHSVPDIYRQVAIVCLVLQRSGAVTRDIYYRAFFAVLVHAIHLLEGWIKSARLAVASGQLAAKKEQVLCVLQYTRAATWEHQMLVGALKDMAEDVERIFRLPIEDEPPITPTEDYEPSKDDDDDDSMDLDLEEDADSSSASSASIVEEEYDPSEPGWSLTGVADFLACRACGRSLAHRLAAALRLDPDAGDDSTNSGSSSEEAWTSCNAPTCRSLVSLASHATRNPEE